MQEGSVSETGERSFTIGNVFSRALGVMSGAAVTVFGISLLFGAIPQAIWSFFLPTLLTGLQPGEFGPMMTVLGLGGLVLLAFSLLTQGALVRTTIDHAEERSTSIGQAIATGVAMILPLLGLALIMMIGLAIGMLLLLVPGIILFLMWSVAAPALVDERPGVIGALRRSRELTKGYKWKIFGLFLVMIILLWVVMIVVGVGAVATGTTGALSGNPAVTPSAMALFVGLVFNTLFIGFWSTMTNALFVELRHAKEGLAPDNLAEVFA